MEKKELTLEEIVDMPLPKPSEPYLPWQGWKRITADDLRDYQGR